MSQCADEQIFMTKTLAKVEDASRHSDGEAGRGLPAGLLEAEGTLARLASVFFPADETFETLLDGLLTGTRPDAEWPDVVSRYRILVEQIPAVVFMAFL